MDRFAERNKRIRKEVQRLRDDGLSLTVAIAVTAKRFYLSERTVQDILYDSRLK